MQTIQSPVLRSVLIEINRALPLHEKIVQTMQGLGFQGSFREVARSQDADGQSYAAGNFIFTRE